MPLEPPHTDSAQGRSPLGLHLAHRSDPLPPVGPSSETAWLVPAREALRWGTGGVMGETVLRQLWVDLGVPNAVVGGLNLSSPRQVPKKPKRKKNKERKGE